MKEQPNYYAIISAEVRYDENLTANAKLLYAEITALLNMNGECFATNKYFSNTVARAAISVPGSDTSGITYNSSTGEITLPDLDGGTY